VNEVVKRIQSRQGLKIKNDQTVSLCIAESGMGTYPVVLPYLSVDVGDLVWFPISGGTVQGKIVFVGYCTTDSDLWEGILAATKTEPIIATSYATVRTAKSGEADG
jgi:hypothetical protein